ncbi:MAG: hypothetical protein ORN51_10125 [Akkermansiaceae bacterium]|nr:hypothetical protein [Akkermansiaceae bacterium]
MNSIDPVTPASADPRGPMAPPYVDEDPEMAMIFEGLETAENEIREAVADAYEASARVSFDPTESLNDIDYTEAEEPSASPELAAMHEEYIPSSEDDGNETPQALGRAKSIPWSE